MSQRGRRRRYGRRAARRRCRPPGHPIAATGVANIWEVCHRLRGEGGDRQIANAKIGLIGIETSVPVKLYELDQS